jgi:hypothetical protein
MLLAVLAREAAHRAHAASPIVNLDNVNGTLSGDLLCQVATQTIITPRILRKSSAPDVMNRFTVFGTGNNISVGGDLTERTLMSSMDAEMENPGQRVFPQRPVSFRRNRIAGPS